MAAVTFMVADHLPARLKQTAVPEAFQPYGDGVERSIQALERLPGFTIAGAAANVKRSRAIGSCVPAIKASKTLCRISLPSSQAQALQAAADRIAFDPGIAAPCIQLPAHSALANSRAPSPDERQRLHRHVMARERLPCREERAERLLPIRSRMANASAPSFVRSSSGLNSLSATRRCHASSTSPAPLG
ncbi:hypothetical protein ACG04R_05945 [Roseateles sp. BYS78W]|uniref:Uncharacterized protein n=1 Tax=Pelomonas candidula TaxID=3299025 RepID=A0ABW7H8G4_9BURK